MSWSTSISFYNARCRLSLSLSFETILIATSSSLRLSTPILWTALTKIYFREGSFSNELDEGVVAYFLVGGAFDAFHGWRKLWLFLLKNEQLVALHLNILCNATSPPAVDNLMWVSTLSTSPSIFYTSSSRLQSSNELTELPPCSRPALARLSYSLFSSNVFFAFSSVLTSGSICPPLYSSFSKDWYLFHSELRLCFLLSLGPDSGSISNIPQNMSKNSSVSKYSALCYSGWLRSSVSHSGTSSPLSFGLSLDALLCTCISQFSTSFQYSKYSML